MTLFAQKESTTVARFDHIDFAMGQRTPTDTLWAGDFENGTPTLNGSANGGFVVGNNGYMDYEKGQTFISNSTVVEGALFWFGAKTESGNDPSITVQIRDMDGTGTTDAGAGNTAPGTSLGSVDVAMSAVDTAGEFTAATFSSPVWVGGDFYLGFEVEALYASPGDTVGLVASADGEAGQSELSWEKWNDGSWYTMYAAWPLDIDFGIWAVVDNSSSGIEDENYFQGIKADCYPNPAVDVANIVFDLENASKVSLEIYSVTGQKVFAVDKGQLVQGRHTVDVPVYNMESGTYYYSINANGNRLTKKMVIK